METSTTFRGRLTAELVYCGLQITAEQAQRMLSSLYYRHFSDLEQQDIDATTAEEIGDIIDAVSMLLRQAITDIRLDIGDDDESGYFEKAAQRAQILKVRELNSESIDIERKLHGAKQEAWRAQRTAALEKPDEEAIKELEAQIKSR